MPQPPSVSPAWGFKRSSVAEQAALALRAAIESGQLSDPLPGESQLARRLGVSRPSVREALGQLQRLGLVAIRKGRRTRIDFHGSAQQVDVPQRRLCVILPGTEEAQFLLQSPLMLHLRAEAVGRGFEWDPLCDPKIVSASGVRKLSHLVKSRGNTCWGLCSCPAVVHEWFAQSRVPSFVLGSCAPGVSLPSVDLNFRAVGWHAAGALSRHGHRRVVLILPSAPMPGDLACSEGFRSYFAQSGQPATNVTEVAMPSASPRHLARLSSTLTGPNRATALFVMREANAIAVYLHVLELGLRVPHDVSLVSRDTHPLIDAAVPQLTRYLSSPLRLATGAMRIVDALFAGRAGRAKPRLVTPQFVPGATLGAASGSDLTEK